MQIIEASGNFSIAPWKIRPRIDYDIVKIAFPCTSRRRCLFDIKRSSMSQNKPGMNNLQKLVNFHQIHITSSHGEKFHFQDMD